MLAAMAEACREQGGPNVTVAQVVARSGVSRRTFYELFEDREDCFLATFDEALERARGYVLPAYRADCSWRERIRSSLVALLSFLDDEPSLARLMVVESLSAGPLVLERRSRVLAQVIIAVDAGRAETKRGNGPLPALTAEGVVGGALSVIHSRLSEPGRGSFTELIGPLMNMIVLPYLGPAAARREIEQPVERSPRVIPPVGRNPLHELEMRLTYRTVRVLAAIACHPGGSNREVADGSGITDQGQISKLLARLQGLGLVDNTGASSERGAPNAWTLTGKGWEVEGAIRRQTDPP
jgi:AcrR family transcriptional regulator